MPRFTHADALDNGPVYIKANVNAVWLVPGYTTAMTYASANTAKLASATMTSADAAISASGDSRVLTFTAKAGTATVTAAGPHDLSILYVDTVNGKILTALEETSDQAITSGNPVSFPSATVTYTQPTA